MKVFLYPVVTIEADSEADATDMLLEAIFTAGVGEIPGWCSPPPSFGEKSLQQAAPELLAVLELALRYLEHPDVLTVTEKMALPGSVVVDRARAAIAKATGI